MIESLLILIFTVALAWVFYWALMQEKGLQNGAATGFFATKHDERLTEAAKSNGENGVKGPASNQAHRHIRAGNLRR